MEQLIFLIVLVSLIFRVIAQVRKTQEEARRRMAEGPASPLAPPPRVEPDDELQDQPGDEEATWDDAAFEEFARARRPVEIPYAPAEAARIIAAAAASRMAEPPKPVPQQAVPLPPPVRRKPRITLTHRSLRDAIILSEVVGPPLAFRDDRS